MQQQNDAYQPIYVNRQSRHLVTCLSCHGSTKPNIWRCLVAEAHLLCAIAELPIAKKPNQATTPELADVPAPISAAQPQWTYLVIVEIGGPYHPAE